MIEAANPIRVFINPEIMELLPAYLRRRDGDVILLQSYIADNDFHSIQVLGHKLCGNGSIFGFEQISKTGKDLESAAQDRDMHRVRKYSQELFVYLENIEICPESTQ